MKKAYPLLLAVGVMLALFTAYAYFDNTAPKQTSSDLEARE